MKRFLYVLSFFFTTDIFFLGHWKSLWMRIFVHKNLHKFPDELRVERNRRRKIIHKMKYGTTGSLKNKYGAQILARDGSRCRHCKHSMYIWDPICTVDHIVPVSKGGKNELGNLQFLCQPCNNKKGNDKEPVFEAKAGTYKLFEEAFARAGIKVESTSSQSVQPSPLSGTSSPIAVSPASTGQSR